MRRLSLTTSLAIIALLSGGAILLLNPEPTQQLVRGLFDSTTTSDVLAVENTSPSNEEAPLKTGAPTQLSIPSSSIELEVAAGVYYPKTKTWTLSSDKAHFAVMSQQPNNKAGNTFIYGHNRRSVFSSLSSLKPGDHAYIKTNNGLTFTYRYIGSQEVPSVHSEIFSYQGPPILTIQTCSGSFYQNRQLFRFDLVSVF